DTVAKTVSLRCLPYYVFDERLANWQFSPRSSRPAALYERLTDTHDGGAHQQSDSNSHKGGSSNGKNVFDDARERPAYAGLKPSSGGDFYQLNRHIRHTSESSADTLARRVHKLLSTPNTPFFALTHTRFLINCGRSIKHRTPSNPKTFEVESSSIELF